MNRYSKEDMAERTPKVSVIMPVFNSGELLPRAIRSVLNQTYGNFELIVVDDGSSEDVKNITDSFKDARIICLRHDVNRGQAEARNTGIRASTGDLVEFLDADDEYLPEKTRRQVDVFLSGDADAAYCGIWQESHGRRKYVRHPAKALKWFFMPLQIMLRRKCFDEAGFFNTDFRCTEDLEYVYRLSRLYKFAGTAEPLAVYHDTPCSITTNLMPMIRDEQLFIGRYGGILPRREKSDRYYNIGKLYMRHGKKLNGYRNFLRAYITYPLNRKTLKKLVRHAPDALYLSLKEH